jgi:FkbM family methyltransferase
MSNDPYASLPSPARIRVARLIFSLPPLRWRPVREQYIRTRRAMRRRARRAAEARGDDSGSRPALYDLDLKLDQHLDMDGGFFVEAGANDGYEQSNTYWLERFRGWRGVLVEAIPSLHREAVLERPASRVFNCALVGPERDGSSVTMHYGGLMSVVEGAHGSDEADREYQKEAFRLGMESGYTVEVPGRTLSSILDEAGSPEVDLLTLDVEGIEVEALRGLDLDRHAPRFIVVEIVEMEADRPLIESVLGERYEPVEQLSPIDMLYRRR